MADEKKPNIVVNKDAAITVYSNLVNIEVSPWDFRLRFRRFGDSSESELQIDELAVVFLSPPQAKAFVVALTRQLKIYEDNHGEIPSFGAAAKDEDAKTQSLTVELPDSL